ncbi:hypothetical protein DICVIV_00551 [Dictyocaulus viviparus]|uniref:PDZ domain-containing protein n=1 Tax=Dictyocaulus viviparus TaxID=29172 RepID=A0A0D8Y944_DICVI|nr:hypothetical protein DICVIV_00551 [Dictyocaulus viviparus]
MNDTDELTVLRNNADNLGRCLHALLERIENLENKPRSRTSDETTTISDEERSRKSEQVDIYNSMSTESTIGLQKHTTVPERLFSTKAYHTLPLDLTLSISTISNGRILSPGYQARAVHIDAKQLNQIEVETISSQLVVVRVNASATHDIHPGDTITHVNGKPVVNEEAISNLTGRITLTLVPSAIHNAPSVFYRVNADYCSDLDDSQICRWLSIDVKKGDVVQVMSHDKKWYQVIFTYLDTADYKSLKYGHMDN